MSVKRSDKPSPFQIQVEEPEDWQRVIKIEVSRAHFDQQYAQRLHQAAKRHVRPGFRKGKTPKQVVEREIGDRLRAETLEQIVPEAFKQAIVQHDLVPITDPVFENLVYEPDKPISFQLVIEVRPKITARDFNDLPISQREPEVKDADVDDVLERLRENRALFEKVNRPAQASDQIVVDLTPLDEEGQPDEARRAADQIMELGANTNFGAFNEAFTAARAGDQKQVQVAYPDDHHREALRGRTVTFQCEIKEIRQKILPELNDTFASSLQEGQTLLELRQAIRADLLREEQAQIDRELEEQIVDALIARNEISVPPSLIEEYLKSGLDELHSRDAQLGRSSSPGEDEQYRQLTRPVAERILKGMFIMEAIRRQEGISVTEEETEERIEQIARQHNLDVVRYRQYAAQGSERDRIVHGLEERKTFDFLLSRAKVQRAGAAAE